MTVEGAYDTVFIVNPYANGGSAKKIWAKKISPLLADDRVVAALGRMKIEHLDSTEDATTITSNFAREGIRKVVVVGGDHTIHNVVKGLIENDELINPDIELGVFPIGEGNDFSLSLGMNNKYQEMVDHLVDGTPNKTDIAYVEYQTESGTTEKSYFLNTASIGLSAEISRYLSMNKKKFNTLNYAIAAAKVCPNYTDPTVEVQVNEETPVMSTLKTAIVANGNFCGKGMKMAPHAVINDGQVDLILFTQGKISQLGSMMSKLKNGRHLSCEGIELKTANVIKISPTEETEQVFIEVNGFIPGVLPATFSINPQQIKLIYKK